MVNNTSGHREKILNILKNSGSAVSGNMLGSMTGISRVAVWKHVKALTESGYDIKSSREGYLLKPGPVDRDILNRLEIQDFAGNIHIYPVLDSTMGKARELARRGGPGMSVITAETQTAGVGTRKRGWESRPGGLYFTLILRPAAGIHFCNLYTLAASLSVVSALDQTGITSRPAWPNDIYSGQDKIAGILPEVCGTPDTIEYILLGIGININNETSCGTSVKKISGKNFARASVLESFLKDLSGRLETVEEQAAPEWFAAAGLGGKRVSVKKGEKVVTGRVERITREGNLLVVTDSGEKSHIFPGDETIHKAGIK